MTTSDYKLVKITWLDAHAVTTGWEPIAELDDEPCVVESVGFLLPGVKAGHHTIAQSVIDSNEECDHVLSIPSKMIIRFESVSAWPLLPVEPEPET
jgi:hypothetical protein